MSDLVFEGARRLSGTLKPSGDKSVSHRALLFGAISSGVSCYEGFLASEDCLCTLQALRELGVTIHHDPAKQTIEVHGVGMHGLKQPSVHLNMGNSGTAMRLMMGLLAGQKLAATLFGDESLSSRPMRRVTDPLKQMGAQIKGGDKGNFAPLTIQGGPLKSIEFQNKLRSAQVKSAILLAGLYADGVTRVLEDVPSRDHTERFLHASGAVFLQKKGVLEVQKSESLKPLSGRIPGDISSAAFFIVGAALTPGSDVTFQHVGLNPTRTGLLDVLKRMGADIEIIDESEIPEPIGTIRVRGGQLVGTRIARDEVPALIDELPILMVAMSLAKGESIVSGAEELRVKETDRILAMVTNLKKAGAEIEELADGCVVRGVPILKGAEIDSFGDHRVAMSFAIASLVSKGGMRILNTDCIATSYPEFTLHFNQLAVRT